MQNQQIADIINKHIPATNLQGYTIQINEHNEQIELLSLIFPAKITTFSPLSIITPILQDIDNLTTDDEYGDLTECNINYTTFYEIPDDPTGEQYINITMRFNIDS